MGFNHLCIDKYSPMSDRFCDISLAPCCSGCRSDHLTPIMSKLPNWKLLFQGAAKTQFTIEKITIDLKAEGTELQWKIIQQCNVKRKLQNVRHLFDQSKASKNQIAEHFNYFHCFNKIVLPNDVLHLKQTLLYHPRISDKHYFTSIRKF